MPQLIMKLNVNRVDLVDEGANSAAFIKMYKRKETSEDMEFDQILEKMKPEHAEIVKAEIEKAKGEIPEELQEKLNEKDKALTDKDAELEKTKKDLEDVTKAKEVAEELVAKSKVSTQEPNMEEVIKGLDPAVQAVFKQMQDKADAAVAIAKAAEEARVEEEAVAKAKDLSFLPVEQDKLVTVMKGINTEVYDILKAANKIIGDSGLFTEVGKKKDGESEGDAWSQIEKKAEDLSKEQKITKAKAIATVIKENPELYKQYLGGNE